MTRWPRSVWIPILAMALVVFGWRIWSVPFTNWDEGIYANVNWELFQTHDWLHLTYFNQTFLEKPPLQFWLTYSMIGLFGPTEVAMRWWSVVAGVATVFVLGRWAWQASRNRWLVWLVSGMFIFGRFGVYHAFRTGDLDGLLTLCITGALYSYWRSDQRPRWWLGWGIGAGLAIMTKSFAGLIPLIVVGLDVVAGWRWKQLAWRQLGWGLAALVLIAAPWHIAETVRFGQAFWHSYLNGQVLDRTTTSLFNTTPWWWYVDVLRSQFFPWSLFLPLALMISIRRWWHERSTLDRLMVVWLAAVLIIFSFIQTRREWYILALYPAAALMIGRMWFDLWSSKSRWWIHTLFWLGVGGVFYYVLLELSQRGVLWKITPYRFLPADLWHHWLGRMVVAVVSAGLLWLIARWCRRFRLWPTWQWSILLTTFMAGLLSVAWMTLFLRHLPTTLPLKTLAAKAEQLHTETLSVIGVNLKGQPAGYFYLLRLQDIRLIEQPAGSSPVAPVVLTVADAKEALVTRDGRVVLKQGPFVLLDLR